MSAENKWTEVSRKKKKKKHQEGQEERDLEFFKKTAKIIFVCNGFQAIETPSQLFDKHIMQTRQQSNEHSAIKRTKEWRIGFSKNTVLGNVQVFDFQK